MPTGHTNYSISDLDLRMIKSVPPGGNWKDIPVDIPSKRLEQIRKSGGRTTLYGRLVWDLPSFTITTYFNRPGNGTYIHPDYDRVITSAEAARLQSFPDNFVFFGPKSHRTKQIGNAVPPLLAYAIAKQIKFVEPQLEGVVDLFCGAGGMSLGFHWAGFNAVVANDNYKEASKTYTQNNPFTQFVFGDIRDRDIKKNILTMVEKSDVQIVIGGPPCQGFSLAGKRLIDDPRNELYKEFVEIVETVSPSIFVMENVEGIISMQDGKVYEEIRETFENLGYMVEGRKLLASEFAVPQRRKRVVIIGSKLNSPSEYFPKPFLSKPSFLTVRDAIGDLLVKLESDIDISVNPTEPTTTYQKFMQGEIDVVEFLKKLEISN